MHDGDLQNSVIFALSTQPVSNISVAQTENKMKNVSECCGHHNVFARLSIGEHMHVPVLENNKFHVVLFFSETF